MARNRWRRRWSPAASRSASPIPAPRRCISSPRSTAIEGMRAVLCLFEGVATGAADGYGRMAGKAGRDPAASRPGPRQRPRQPAQRAARRDADRQRRRRSRDLSSPLRRAADLRHRRLRPPGLRAGSASRPSARTVAADAARAVQAARAAPGGSRHVDPARRHAPGARPTGAAPPAAGDRAGAGRSGRGRSASRAGIAAAGKSALLLRRRRA